MNDGEVNLENYYDESKAFELSGDVYKITITKTSTTDYAFEIPADIVESAQQAIDISKGLLRDPDVAEGAMVGTEESTSTSWSLEQQTLKATVRSN